MIIRLDSLLLKCLSEYHWYKRCWMLSAQFKQISGCWQPWRVWFESLCRAVCHQEELCWRTFGLTWDTQPCHSSGICPLRVGEGCERHRSTPPSDTPQLCSTVWGHLAVLALVSSVVISWASWWSSWEAAGKDTAPLHNNNHWWAWQTKEPQAGPDLTMV